MYFIFVNKNATESEDRKSTVVIVDDNALEDKYDIIIRSFFKKNFFELYNSKVF